MPPSTPPSRAEAVALSAPTPFSCSWCGIDVAPRDDDSLERWTLLCATCLERAPTQPYLRTKLREGMRRRANNETPPIGIPLPTARADRHDSTRDLPTSLLAGVSAEGAPRVAVAANGAVPARLGLLPPPGEPDQLEAWYLNRAPFDRGPVSGATWQGELDRAVLWLDALPFTGRIVELGAGIGFWTVLLASRGETSAYDAREDRLTRARQRLMAHGLKAHLHPRAIDVRPEGEPAGLLLLPFVLSQLDASARARQIAVALEWLAPGGRIALIDLAPPNFDAALLEHAAAEMLGPQFESLRTEATGRHLILIDAIARPR